MGTKERKQREFAEREAGFLTAARKAIGKDGLLNLQMSKLANECDYSTGTLYQHFASKEDLLVALTTSVLEDRVRHFSKVDKMSARSRHKMLAVLLADMQFIKECPEYFAIEQYAYTETIWMAASEQRREENIAASRPLGDIVHRIVEEALDEGDLPAAGQSVQSIALGVWTQLVGMHQLTHKEGLLDAYEIENPYEILMVHVNYMFNGMNWAPLLDMNDKKAWQQIRKNILNEVFPANDH